MGGGDGEWWVVRVSIRSYKKIERWKKERSQIERKEREKKI